MIKKFSKKFIAIFLLSLVATFCMALGVIAGAEDGIKVGLSSPLAEKVKIGEVVQLPDYYVEDNGESIKAEVKVISPQGKVYTGTKFTADEAGRYTVVYSVDGEQVYTAYCITVIGAEDLLSTNALAEVDGIANYKYNSNDSFKGVAVNVENGGTITYTKEIDVASLTKNDLLFEATIEPNKEGDADFKQIVMTFSDVLDPSSNFRVTITDGHADGGSPKFISYVNVAASGQTAGGYNYDNAQKGVFWEAKDIYGTSIFSSFRAERSGGNSEYSFKLYYDAKENALYTYRYGNITLVSDFDDPVIFPSTSWSGFSSGKAKLTISFVDVKSDGGRVIINEVAGLRLTQEEIIDDQAPELEIDLLGQSKAPNSTLGAKYKVFPFTTYDFFDSNVAVKVSVNYENTLTGNKTDVSVTDGEFITNKLGKYTIRYEATDYSGNTTVKDISFDCVASVDEIEMEKIPDDFSTKVFETVTIPTANEVRGFGGSGDLKITLKVIDPDGEEVKVDGGLFVTEKIGVYQAIYTAVDFYGVTKEEKLSIDVKESDKTIFTNQIVLPELLISGFEYTIPEVYAKTCHGGEVVDCKIDYYVNGQKLGEDRTFTASGDSLKVECFAYVIDENDYESIEKTLVVVNGEGGKNQASYFYDKQSFATITELMDSVDITSSKDTTVEFVNKLKGSEFSLGVSYIPEQVSFSALKIILCDAEDESNSVTLTFELLEDKVNLTVPFGVATEFSSMENYFKLIFNQSGLIGDASGVPMAYVDKDDNGNDFKGFENGLYAKISLVDVRKESTVSLISLNNQPLGFRSEYEEDIGDNIGPEIEILGEISVKAKKGDKVTIYSCRAYDVLSQVEKVTVSVQSPSWESVVAERIADEDIQIVVSECGYYRVVYTAVDTAGKQTILVRNIRVVDAIAPTLKVDYSDATKKVGETVKLPKVTVSDDSDTVYYDIFVSLPNSEMRLVLHYENGTTTSYLDKNDNSYPNSFKVSNDSFKVEMKGKYVITVMAYDGDYNTTIQSFTITVK